jgi:hypothetical protein
LPWKVMPCTRQISPITHNIPLKGLNKSTFILGLKTYIEATFNPYHEQIDHPQW